MANKTNIYGTQVLSVPKPKIARKEKEPTQKEIKEQLAKEISDKAEFVGQELNKLVSDPMFTNASFPRKQELIKNFEETQWKPFLSKEAAENPDLAAVLDSTKVRIIDNGVMKQAANALEEGGIVGDTLLEAKGFAARAWDGATNVFPAAIDEAKVNSTYNKILAEDERFSTNDEKIIQAAIKAAKKIYKTENPTDEQVQERLNFIFDKYEERRAEYIKELDATNESLNENLKASAETAKYIEEEVEAKKSGLYKDRLIRDAERKEEGTSGMWSHTAAGFDYGTISGLRLFATDLLAMAPALGTSAVVTAGTTVATAPVLGPGAAGAGLAAGAATMGALSGADAAYSNYQSALNIPEEELSKTKEYQDLLAMGYTPQTARTKLALYSASQGGLSSGAINTVLGLTGGAGNIIFKGTSNVALRASGNVATNTVAKGGLIRGVGTTLRTAAYEGGTNALDSLSINYAVAANTGVYKDLMTGVGDAFIMGSVLGGGTRGVSNINAGRRTRAEARAKADSTGLNSSEKGGLAGLNALNAETPREISSAVAERTGISEDGVRTISKTNDEWVPSVKRKLNKVKNTLGRAIDTDLLTERDVTSYHNAMQEAVDAGIPVEVVKAYEQAFKLNERSDYTPFVPRDDTPTKTVSVKAADGTVSTVEVPLAQEPASRTLVENEGEYGDAFIIRDDIVYGQTLTEDGTTVYEPVGHVLRVGLPEGSTQTLPEFETVNGVQVVRRRKPKEDTMNEPTVDSATEPTVGEVLEETIEPPMDPAPATHIMDEGTTGDSWYIKDGVLFEAISVDQNTGRASMYREVGPVTEVGFPRNSIQNPDGILSTMIVDDYGNVVSPLTGLTVESIADLNRELVVLDYVTATTEATQAIAAAREAGQNIPPKNNGKKYSKSVKAKRDAERELKLDALLDAVTEGLTKYYFANGGDINYLRSVINSLVPEGSYDRPLFNLVQERLQSLARQANEEMATIITESTMNIGEASAHLNEADAPEARKTLGTLLSTSDTTEAIEGYKRSFRARMDAEPTTFSESIKAHKNAQKARKRALRKRRANASKRVETLVNKMKQGVRIKEDGTVTDLTFLEIAEAMLPFYMEHGDGFTYIAGKINSLEPAFSTTNNRLTARLQKFYEGLNGTTTEQTASGRSREVGYKINSLLESYTRRRTQESPAQNSGRPLGDSATTDGGGISRTAVEGTREGQANEVPTRADGSSERPGDTVSGTNPQSTPAKGGRKNPSSRSTRSAGHQQPNNGGGVAGARGQGKDVNQAKSTDLITGEVDTSVTPNGLQPTKLSRAVRKNITDFGGNTDITLRVEAIESITQAIEDGTLRTPEELAEAYRMIDALTAELYELGMPNLDKDQATGKAHEEISQAIGRELTPEEKTALQEFTESREDSTSSNEVITEMTREAVVESGGDNPSPRYRALPEAIKNIFRKIAKAIAGGIIVFSTWTGLTHVVDTTSAAGGVTIEAPTVANNSVVSGFSDRANATFKFVKDYNDNGGKPYMIADKNTGMIYMMSPDHQVIASAPALYGKNMGDAPVVGQTPAGAFQINVVDAPASYGGNIAEFATTRGGDVFSIHRMINKKGQDRPGRLLSDQVSDKRISDGCINVPEQFYDAFIGKGGAEKVYIVPDSTEVANVFTDGAYRNIAAESSTGRTYDSPASQTVSGYKTSLTNLSEADMTVPGKAIQELSNGELMQTRSVIDLDNTGTTASMGLAGLLASTAGMGLGASLVRRPARGGKGGNGRSESGKGNGGRRPDIAEVDIPTDVLAGVEDSAIAPVEQTASPVVDESVTRLPEDTAVDFDPLEFDYVLGFDDLVTIDDTPIGTESRESFIATDGKTTSVAVESDSTVILVPNDNGHVITGNLRDFDPTLVAPKRVGTLDKAKIKMTRWFTGEKIAPIYEFLLSNFKIAQESITQHPLVQAIASMDNRKRFVQGELTRKHLEPVLDEVRKIASETGLNPADAMQYVGSWATLRHIPEANAALLRQMIARRDALLASISEAMTPGEYENAHKAISRVTKEIQDFESAQRTGVIPDGSNIRMAGGLTDLQAATAMDALLESGISVKQFDKAQGMIRDSYRSMLEEAVERGIVTSESLAVIRRNNFDNYVPLYVADPEAGSSSTTRSTNLADVMLDREGGNNPPVDAITAMHRYINAFSTSAGEVQTARVMNAMYEQLVQAGDQETIIKVPLRDGNRTKNGITFYETTTLPDGTPKTERFLIRFNQKPELNNSLKHTTRERTTLGKYMSAATRVKARLVTAFTPIFPIMNTIGDFFERGTNTFVRSYLDDAGNRISSTALIVKYAANMSNPMMLYQLSKGLKSKKFEGKYGRYLQEMAEQGGLSLFSEQIYETRNHLEKQLKKGNVRAGIDIINKANQLYNDIPNGMPALAQYSALRDSGVSAERATGMVLETMNFSKRGAFTTNVDAAFPFVNSVLQGGANIANNFGLGVGQKFFSGKNAARLAKIGGLYVGYILLSAATRQQMGTDEDGDWVQDLIPMDALRGRIPFFASEEDKDKGTFTKVPAGFGTNQMLWVAGVMLDRYQRGKATEQELLREVALTVYTNAFPDMTPGFSFQEDPFAWMTYTLLPDLARPFVAAANGPTHFGNNTYNDMGHYADASPNYTKGKGNTPSLYTNAAKFMYDTVGLDFYPEQFKAVVDDILGGPLTALNEYIKQDSIYFNKIRAEHDMDPAMYLLGLNRLEGNVNKFATSQYFRDVRKVMKKLGEDGIYYRDLNYVSGKSPERKDRMVSQMRDKGYTTEQIADVVMMLDTIKQYDDLNRDSKTFIKSNAGWALEGLSSDFIEEYYAEASKKLDKIALQFSKSFNIGRWQ